jgi:hypothetical protein
VLTYRITFEVQDQPPVIEEGDVQDPVGAVRHLLSTFLSKQSDSLAGLSTPTSPAFTRLAIEFFAAPAPESE